MAALLTLLDDRAYGHGRREHSIASERATNPEADASKKPVEHKTPSNPNDAQKVHREPEKSTLEMMCHVGPEAVYPSCPNAQAAGSFINAK